MKEIFSPSVLAYTTPGDICAANIIKRSEPTCKEFRIQWQGEAAVLIARTRTGGGALIPHSSSKRKAADGRFSK
ncbi:hypothetical protein NDU88_003734 [Pleurodeles waltl]|uniref:Uncharacterized protein n=1 Tax=Pleurodeles waltl TaxID=8319 RepID=A0AAV7W4C3_PLEWA|nr:hypothetical protein NDU88_003734 [Pleurodeles waltl]